MPSLAYSVNALASAQLVAVFRRSTRAAGVLELASTVKTGVEPLLTGVAAPLVQLQVLPSPLLTQVQALLPSGARTSSVLVAGPGQAQRMITVAAGLAASAASDPGADRSVAMLPSQILKESRFCVFMGKYFESARVKGP